MLAATFAGSVEHRLRQRPLLLGQVTWVCDAAHSDDPRRSGYTDTRIPSVRDVRSHEDNKQESDGGTAARPARILHALHWHIRACAGDGAANSAVRTFSRALTLAERVPSALPELLSGLRRQASRSNRDPYSAAVRPTGECSRFDRPRRRGAESPRHGDGSSMVAGSRRVHFLRSAASPRTLPPTPGLGVRYAAICAPVSSITQARLVPPRNARSSRGAQSADQVKPAPQWGPNSDAARVLCHPRRDMYPI